MKAKFKKIVAALLSAMMVLTMCVATNVHAAGETQGVVTLKTSTEAEPLTGRSFAVYKLFNLKTNADGNKFSYTQYTPETTAVVKKVLMAEPFKVAETALTDEEAIVTKINELNEADKDFKNKFAAALGNETLTQVSGSPFTAEGATLDITLDYGYYLIVEKTDYSNSDKKVNPTYTVNLLKSVYKPTHEVILKSDLPDVEKVLVESPSTNDKGSDYSIGDTVSFKVTGTAPRTGVINEYEKYEFSINDTLSTGLTLNQDSIKVLLNGKETTGYEVTPSTNSFVISFANLKGNAQLNGNEAKNVVTVEYTAVLNSNAVVETPEKNEVTISYSNKPGTEEKGTSEKEIVYVYNFGLDIAKVSGDAGDNKKALTGAEFRLFTATTNDVTVLTNAVVVAGDNGKYEKTTGVASVDNTTLKVDEDGKLIVDGLADGTYYLYETKAPDGYNLLKKPVEIVIESTYNEKGELLTHKCTVDGTTVSDEKNTAGESTPDNRFEITVENKSGLVLPETGGMGTTILYLVGILAMAGGVCYFVMDKRRKAQVK